MHPGEAKRTPTPDSSSRQQALVEFARAVLVEGGRAQLFELAARALSDGLLAPCAGAAEVEVHRDGRRLRLRAENGFDPSLRGVAFGIGTDSQPGYTIEANATVVCEDPSTERRFRASATARKNALVSQVSAPIPGRTGPQGVVIAGFTELRRISAEEATFVTHVGEVLGAALSRLDRERSHHDARQVMDLMRDALLVMRSDGKLLDANARALELYGYSRAELLERSILDLRASVSLSDVLWQMRQAGTTGLLFETVHRRKDGSIFSCEVSSRGAMLDGVHVLVSVVRERPDRQP